MGAAHTKDQIRYSKHDLLGRGLSSAVYEGSFGAQNVATPTEFRDASKSFETLSKFQHVNVLKFYHMEENPTYELLVMDLCRTTLKEWVKTGG